MALFEDLQRTRKLLNSYKSQDGIYVDPNKIGMNQQQSAGNLVQPMQEVEGIPEEKVEAPKEQTWGDTWDNMKTLFSGAWDSLSPASDAMGVAGQQQINEKLMQGLEPKAQSAVEKGIVNPYYGSTTMQIGQAKPSESQSIFSAQGNPYLARAQAAMSDEQKQELKGRFAKQNIELGEKEQKYLHEFKQIQDDMQSKLKSNGEKTFMQGVTESIAQSTPAMLRSVGAGIVGGGFGRGYMLFSDSAANYYAQARTNGMDRDTALRYASEQGAVEAVTEYVPTMAVSKILKDSVGNTAIKEIGKEALKAILADGGGEIVANFLQNLNDGRYNFNEEVAEKLKQGDYAGAFAKSAKGSVEAFVAGVLMSSSASLAAATPRLPRLAIDAVGAYGHKKAQRLAQGEEVAKNAQQQAEQAQVAPDESQSAVEPENAPASDTASVTNDESAVQNTSEQAEPLFEGFPIEQGVTESEFQPSQDQSITNVETIDNEQLNESEPAENVNPEVVSRPETAEVSEDVAIESQGQKDEVPNDSVSEINTNDATETSDETSKYSLIEDPNSDFAKAVDEVANNKQVIGYIPMGKTPDVLKMLGLPNTGVFINGSVLSKVMGGKHNLTQETLKQLPQQLNNPIAVMKSAPQASRKGYVILTELIEVNPISHKQEPVISALHLNKTKRGFNVVNIASVYGKNLSGLQNMLNNDLLYWHNAKGSQFLNAFQLQLPSHLRSDANLSASNIKTESDLSQYSHDRTLLEESLGKEMADKVELKGNTKGKGLKSQNKDRAEGYHERGADKVVINTENIYPLKNKKGEQILSRDERLKWVAHHELFHRGVSTDAGSRLLNRSLKAAYGNPVVKELANKIRAYYKSKGVELNAKQAVEEGLAELRAAIDGNNLKALVERWGLESRASKSAIQKVYDRVRHAIEQILSKITGRTVSLTDNEVVQLIKDISSKATEQAINPELKNTNNSSSNSVKVDQGSARFSAAASLPKSERIEKLRQSKPIHISGKDIQPSEDLRQYKRNALNYGKTLRGSYVNKDTGQEIKLGRAAIQEVLRHDYKNPDHLQSIAAIPQIIEESIYIDTLENEDKSKHPDIANYDYYVSGLSIGGENYTVRAVIANSTMGEKYYDHKLSEIEKGDLLEMTSRVSTAEISNQSPLSDINDKRLLQILQDNDNANYSLANDNEFDETAKKYGGEEAYQEAVDAGKTELDYRQWVQVRTPAFKKWFGDWELAQKAHQIDQLKAQDVNHQNLSNDEVKSIYKGIGDVVNVNDQRTVNFVQGALGKILRHKGVDQRVLVPQLDTLFAQSIPLYFEPQRTDKVKQQTNIVGYHNYLNKVRIDGNDYFVRFTVQEVKSKKPASQFNPNQLHSSFISDVEMYNATDTFVNSQIINRATQVSGGIVDSKLAQFLEKVNDAKENSSKVINPKTGEPLVVYHGSIQAGFSVFDVDGTGKTQDSGAYFTSNPRTARTYSGTEDNIHFDKGYSPEEYETQAANYGVFLNLRKLDEYDFEGRNWDSFEPDEWLAVNEEGEVLAYFDNRKDAQEYQQDNPEVVDVYNGTEFKQSTDMLARQARSSGYDGAVMRNVVDEGTHDDGYEEESDVFVVFERYNIKSATDNTGDFSSNNDDIRYSLHPINRPKAESIEKLRKAKSIKISGKDIEPSTDLRQYKRNALNHGKNLRGSYVNKDTGQEIKLGLSAVKEVLNHDYKDPDHLQSIAAIPQIIEDAVYIDTLLNEDEIKNPHISSYDYYVAGLNIGGDDYTVRAVIANADTGERYYDHKLTDISKDELLSTAGITTPSFDNSSSTDINDKRLLQILQDNDNASYSLNESPNSEFARAVDEIGGGKKVPDGNGKFIHIGTTPDVLQLIGLPKLKVRINESVIEKVMGERLGVPKDKYKHLHNLTVDDVKRLPAELNDPVAVFKSATRNKSVVVLTELQEHKTKNSKLSPVVAALHIKPTKKGVDIVDVRSFYGRSLNQIQTAFEDYTLYVNKAKGQQFLNTHSLQLGWDFTSDADLSAKDIMTDEDLRQYQSLQNGEVSYSINTPEDAVGATSEQEKQGWIKFAYSGKDTFIRRLQDRFRPIKQLQDAIAANGGKVNLDNNTYLAEERYHGQVENDIRLMRERFIEPLAEMMKKYKITQNELDEFLIMRHAEERNNVIAKRNKKMPDGGSGVKTADAIDYLNKLKADGRYQQFMDAAQIVYKMNELQRQVMASSGLTADSTMQTWSEQYKYYVPLKGISVDNGGDPTKPRTGKGFNTGGKETKIALGRNSMAVNVTAQVINDLTEKLVRARKNIVGQHLLKLVRDNPDPDFWNIYSEGNPDYEQGYKETKANGLEAKPVPVQMWRSPEKYFAVKEKGKIYYIKINDKNLMNALNNITPSQHLVYLTPFAKVNRWLAAMNTSFSPEFVISNFARDVQTAYLNLNAEATRDDGKVKGENIANKTIKDILSRKPMKAIWAHTRGKDVTDPEIKRWVAYYNEFMLNGAKTGFIQIKDTEAQKKELDKLLEEPNPTWGAIKKTTKAIIDVIDDANNTVENQTRLAAYVNAREAGFDAREASSLAKNMTVNFNRRGEYGANISALYLFANASVQGSANFIRTMGSLNGDKKLRWRNLNRAQKFGLIMIATGYGLGLMNRMLSDEDDDGELFYDKIPDFVKERNIIIMKNDGKGGYWKIPLPYGYNIFHVLGSTAESVIAGKKSVGKASMFLTNTILGSFSPISLSDSNHISGWLLKNAAPSATKPFMDLYANENFSANPIHNDMNMFGAQTPASSSGRMKTPEVYKQITQYVNKLTGGSEYRSGWLDFYPEDLKYIVDTIGGGAMRFWGVKIVSSNYDKWVNDIDYKDQAAGGYPFLSLVSAESLPYEDQTKYYDRRNEILQLAKERKNIGTKDMTPELRAKLRFYGKIKASDNQLKSLRKQRDRIYSNENLTPRQRFYKMKAIEDRMGLVIDRFNKRYNQRIEE
ncbi:hypothetical protein HPC38_01395 [Pasteurellaceae bacterium HPA106]|uniref:LPD3 domain-containing protein n=1 Tax=Spirabiliibacterium pneumoniae TaxID=221400 RepID=UPI001AACA9DF|nr:LPD38 domain-containing protein [Spirabiliibacterium pneumoniae]MBE2895532.1 hypothetical protein [Spirabiliibacterium pneumoniae]